MATFTQARKANRGKGDRPQAVPAPAISVGRTTTKRPTGTRTPVQLPDNPADSPARERAERRAGIRT